MKHKIIQVKMAAIKNPYYTTQKWFTSVVKSCVGLDYTVCPCWHLDVLSAVCQRAICLSKCTRRGLFVVSGT